MNWMIDGKINLTETCEKHNWHLGSVQGALQEQGLTYRDAEAYAHFAFANVAVVADYDADECLTSEQHERLSAA
jgi:hypothetical protein